MSGLANSNVFRGRAVGACAVALGLGLGVGTEAGAKLLEEQHALPVVVTDAYGKSVAQSITLTVFSDDSTPAPRPVLVLNHGRAAEAVDRAALGRVRFLDASRWFAKLGFAVVVPTRVGYGVSGGSDVEDSGDCRNKNYPPGYAAAAEETIAALGFMHERPDTRKDRDVVVGQSYGGMTSVAIAARNLPGVVATVNFAGGGGGNPKTHPQQPCGQPALQKLFSTYGAAAKTPALWIYAQNDMYFGPDLPRQWHAAYQGQGAAARFEQLPPQGEDGHLTFSRSPAVWHPIVLEFLRAQGFDLKE